MHFEYIWVSGVLSDVFTHWAHFAWSTRLIMQTWRLPFDGWPKFMPWDWQTNGHQEKHWWEKDAHGDNVWFHEHYSPMGHVRTSHQTPTFRLSFLCAAIPTWLFKCSPCVDSFVSFDLLSFWIFMLHEIRRQTLSVFRSPDFRVFFSLSCELLTKHKHCICRFRVWFEPVQHNIPKG